MENMGMERLVDAVTFAAERHYGQVRKDGSQYLLHPLAVAKIVAGAGYGEDYVITAVLHDILEDTETTEEEIAVYGEDVLAAVKLLTRPDGMPEEEYVGRILENRMAAVVKNADKIHNLQDLPFNGMAGEKRQGQEPAERYLAKSGKHYRGKFSKALDMALDEAEKQLSDPVIHDRPSYSYTMGELKLYMWNG